MVALGTICHDGNGDDNDELTHLTQPDRRKESSGPGWQEHFVDYEKASVTCSVGIAVSKSLSYVTISDFATTEEQSVLQESALEVKNTGNSVDGIHIMGASESNGAATTRYSVEGLLNQDAKVTSAAFLDRLLVFLEKGDSDSTNANVEMSELALLVFGHNSNLRQLRATWYGEPSDVEGQLFYEPKVNIYEKGGLFNQHEDGMQLTLLVVLGDDFEGGGTAFYEESTTSTHSPQNSSADEEDQNPYDGTVVDIGRPQSICKPPKGTAMIWGGALVHMALPVASGMRAVFVGSFDLGIDPIL